MSAGILQIQLLRSSTTRTSPAKDTASCPSIPSYLPIPLIDIEVLILDRFASGDPTHKVFIIAKLSFILFLPVPRDLQVVLVVNRRRRYGIFATPPSHSRYVYLVSIVVSTVSSIGIQHNLCLTRKHIIFSQHEQFQHIMCRRCWPASGSMLSNR